MADFDRAALAQKLTAAAAALPFALGEEEAVRLLDFLALLAKWNKVYNLTAVREPERAAELPLDIRGTAFEERVWAALRKVPVGTTATYGEIAAAIGAPAAHRAVARACGANGIAVAIPCHRIIRSDGSLAGYRWGVARKEALLKAEADGC